MSETNSQDTHLGKPTGLRRYDPEGQDLIDALAGRGCSFGLGFEPAIAAIHAALDGYLGDANAEIMSEPISDEVWEHDCAASVRGWFEDCEFLSADTIVLTESADVATECAIRFARQRKPDCYRTVALIGSDHGRTAACRTASGRPELHQNYGPMLPGFAHVPANDLDALRATIDEQIACLLLSPYDLSASAKPLEEDYLRSAREICDQHDVAIVVDETKIPIGGTGQKLSLSALAPITVDGLILSSGIFSGMPGGLLVGTEKLVGQSNYPNKQLAVHGAIVQAVFGELAQCDLQETTQNLRDFAVAVAEAIGGFEFVRDVNAHGATLGIEFDIETSELVQLAFANRLRVEAAGDTGIRMLLPINISEPDQNALIERLAKSLTQIERQTSESLQG